MAFEFKLPDLGEGLVEGRIVKWLINEGDKISADQPVVEVETDKAIVQIPAPKAGVALKLASAEGSTVKVGDTLLVIGAEGEKFSGVIVQAATSAASAQAMKKIQASAAQPPPSQATATTHPTHALATPSVRKLALDLGVDLMLLKGTGMDGRITEDDVKKSASGVKTPKPAAAAQQMPAPQVVSPQYGPEERVPMSAIRKRIAENMVKSVYTIPHVHHFDEIDVTALAEMRAQEKGDAEKRGIKLTYLPYIIKALVAALKLHPSFNSSLDSERGEIILKRYYNIGLAVDTEEGLLVPVIKDADRKSILEIAGEIESLAKKARNKTITSDEMRGGTFSITNIGSIGGEFATPIIRLPECAILGVYKIKDKPIVINGKIEIRKIMNVSLSFDHRIADGANAAAFANEVKRRLEYPGLLLADVA